METEKHTPIEHQAVPAAHQAVPAAHQGLHTFLYSSDDEHTATPTTAANLEVTDAVLPLEVWRERSANAKVAGVYAVLDAKRCPQYIGYSRNVLLSLNAHLAKLGPELCALVRVQTFKFPRREAMESLRDAWLAELNSLPPGNGEASDLWTGSDALAAMSPAERQAYEEKKLKLRTAMADTSLSRERDAKPSPAQPPQSLQAAVEQDDWSALIDRQTQETQPVSKPE